MLNDTQLSYRKTAIEGASPIGLVIALYDTMAGDLRRAADALRKNDIETRCRELNHAAIVLGQLEAWVDLVHGGELAQNLSSFYSYLRAKMMEASIKKSALLLEAQMELILQVRSAWQQRDVTPLAAVDAAAGLQGAPLDTPPIMSNDRVAFTVSA